MRTTIQQWMFTKLEIKTKTYLEVHVSLKNISSRNPQGTTVLHQKLKSSKET